MVETGCTEARASGGEFKTDGTLSSCACCPSMMKTYNKTLSQVMNDLHERGFKEQFKTINDEILAVAEKST